MRSQYDILYKTPNSSVIYLFIAPYKEKIVQKHNTVTSLVSKNQNKNQIRIENVSRASAHARRQRWTGRRETGSVEGCIVE